MESLPEINAAARRQWSVTRGTEANSGQHNLGEQIVEANNKGTNQPFTGAVLSQLHLDLYDKLENGSHARRPIRNPTVAGHGEQKGRGRNNSINETEIDVTGAINDSLEAKCASFEHTVRSVDTLTGNKVGSYQLKSTADFCVDDVTLRRPVASTTPVKSRANSTSSVGRDRSGTARRLSAEGNSVSGSRGLRTAESGKPRHRGLSPRRDWGIADGVLTHKERQTVRSLVSPTLVNHLSPEDAWNEDQGNRRRSRSDVRYDALPVLDNGEIDAHSYRFSPTSCHKYIPEIGHSDKPPQGGHHSDSPTHRLIDPRYKLTTQDETSKSNENLHPPSDEQEHGFKSHHKLSKHYCKEAEHFGTQVFNQRSPTESFNTHQEHRTSQLLPTAGRHHRRNAVVHIMESLAERSRSDSFREERYATVTDETQQRGRLRRDTCTLNTSGAPLRFKQGPRDILTLPKRRRAYSDLSSNDKVPSKSIAARRLSINSQQRLMRAQLARQRFEHAIKMVIILLRIHSMVFQKRKHDNNKETMTFTEIAEQFQSADMKSSGLSFDPRDFKAKREINISNEAKNILSMPTYCRTPEQLQIALYGLQTMKSFAEYPLHMQEKLVKVAWFECVPPKRVIIRQGHYAENFYFVISGSAVVTIMETKETGEPHIRTAAVLRKGSSFGELALLHHSKRTATVSSQGEVQLLAIGREDFFDIFMRGQQPGEEPEHVKFLRQLHFMKHWPLERLIEHPEMCLFHFYKRGQVIVKDSNKSDWIYVVKSGSCQVLKQLHAVKPSLPYRSSSLSSIRLPKLHSRHLSAPELPSKRPARTRIRNNSATASYLQFISVPTMSAMNTAQFSEADNHLLVNDPFEGTQSLPDTFLTRQKTTIDRRSTPSESNFSQFTPYEDTSLTSLPSINSRRGATPSRESYSRSKFREIARRNPPPPADRMSCAPKVTVTDDHTSSDSSSSSDSRGSVFVQLELLLPKDVFGLSTLNVDLGIDHEQSSVNLVSRGAECIMIQKDFFAKYCADEAKRHIRSIIKPYPPPELLQHNLQNHSNWTNYKQEAVANILRDRFRTKELRL